MQQTSKRDLLCVFSGVFPITPMYFARVVKALLELASRVSATK
jgi:hypothetical protein